MAEWTNKNVFKLIEMLRERPAMWDYKHKKYKDRNTRHDLLVELAHSFDHEKEEIERKLKNLYSHFTREVKKEESSAKLGSSDSVYKSKWFAYQSMTFLKDKHKPRKTVKPEDEVEIEEQLIILVQGYNELYDTSDPDYNNQLRREFIWGEIGKIMDKSGTECEEKWRTLLESYRTFLEAQDPLNQSTSNGNPYKLGKIMSFMKSHLLERDQKSSYLMEEMEEDSEMSSLIYFSEIDENKTDKKNTSTPKRTAKPADTFKADIEYKKVKPNSADHLTKYFQSIEETCRTLTPELQIMVKTQISQIIHRAELDNLNITISTSHDNL